MRGVRSFLLPLALLYMGVAPAQVTWRTDSLMNTWPVRQHMAELGSTAGRGVVRAVDTRNLYDDLKREAPSIPVFADSNVVLYADLYGEPLRDHFRVLLGVSEVYFLMIEKELVRQGLPADLKYLPMALSAMNSLAGSTNGRAGLWMLTYPVALRYGLQVTAAVDERHDDVKSTMAAGRYLMDLHARYKDWGLTIMAFTCGPANITRAQQRTGGATDYRTLYPHFTEEEQEVLPQLMAFIHLSAQAERLGLEPIAVLPWEPADTL
ncbi:MAG: lytic transglycosylase domain-containing protein, partial [Flavobacteriales bacterium]|nr:lytic transglycosylase domain-containing protein [Flavobacteriales bacterium]